VAEAFAVPNLDRNRGNISVQIQLKRTFFTGDVFFFHVGFAVFAAFAKAGVAAVASTKATAKMVLLNLLLLPNIFFAGAVADSVLSVAAAFQESPARG
jgi:hypothetical protein